MTVESEIEDEMVMVSQPVDVAAFTTYVEENCRQLIALMRIELN